MKIWTYGRSPRSGSRNAWTRIKHVKGASRLSNFWNLFGAIQMISCCEWWPWTKACYITKTRRQSNNQWRHTSSPVPKNFRVQKSTGRVLASMFWNQDGILLIDYLLKGQTINAEYYSTVGEIERHFEGKTPREGHQGCLVLARQYPGSLDTCNPAETGLPVLPFSWSSTLFSVSGSVGLLPVPWTEKTIEKSSFFVRRGGNFFRGDLVGRTFFWIFLSGLQKLE